METNGGERAQDVRYKCDVCNIQLFSEASWQSHLSGKRHKRTTMKQAVYYCEVCDTETGSEASMQDHLRGRKHQMALDKAAEVARSIYVKGVPQNLTREEDVSDLFGQFGQIEHSWVNADKTYAIVEFASEESALRALRHTETLSLGGNKLVVKPREMKARPHPKKTKKGKQKQSLGEGEGVMETERSSEVGVLGGVRLPEGVLESVGQAQTIDKQLQVLVGQCSMPEGILEAQTSLCHALHNLFSAVFPRCLVVPFGAAVSGHALLTSDCDVCLVTEPSAEDVRCLTGPRYLHPLHLTLWKKIATTTSSSLIGPPLYLAAPPTSSPTHADSHEEELESMDSASTTSSCSSPTLPLPRQGCGRGSTTFEEVLSMVHSLPGTAKVVPIRSARCPIVNFYHLPTGTHCDLSVNNRLGPYNTRLLSAYCNFDPRVVPLIRILRLWARESEIRRVTLSSYAISLMVIYALQHATPPVLPCLQDPRGWPKAMEWFRLQGFATIPTDASPKMTVNGWSCDFTPPDSLQPSTNKMSTAELLYHFFNFYSAVFDCRRHVVAVHCPPTTWLSIEDACTLAKSRKGEVARFGDAKATHFAVSPLCIQDPFELQHNVGKLFTKSTFKVLEKRVKSAAYILHQELQKETSGDEKEGSIMAIFNRDRYTQVYSILASMNPELSKVVVLTSDSVTRLLKKTDGMNSLVELVEQLDLTNSDTVRSLTVAVVKAMIVTLEQDLGFVCEPSEVQLTGSSTPCVPDRGISGGLTLRTVVAKGDMLAEEGKMEDQSLCCMEEEGVGKKRQRTEETVVECTKKAKLSSGSSADLLFTTVAGMKDRYICTAYSNCWLHRRTTIRKLRKKQHQQPSAEVSGAAPPSLVSLGHSLPDLPPILQFYISPHDLQAVDHLPEGGVLAVKLTASDSLYAAEFSSFFAYFKKLMTSSPPQV